MTTDAKPIQPPDLASRHVQEKPPVQPLAQDACQEHHQQGWAMGAWHFLRHGLEMCISMCVGWGILGALYIWVAGQVGYASPNSQLPVLSVLVAALNMSVPMAGWMRLRGMEWGPIAEMSGAMFAEAIVLIALAGLGIAAWSSIVKLLHLFMMPVMLIPMFWRLDLYTGRAGHHAHAHAHAPVA